MALSSGAPRARRFETFVGTGFIAAGAAAWATISAQLAKEKITVPADARILAGKRVRGPIGAFAQADTIARHVHVACEGLSYAELGELAEEARRQGDEELAERLTAQRALAMNASMLRSSLFTSVLAYGVSAFVMAEGVTHLLSARLSR